MYIVCMYVCNVDGTYNGNALRLDLVGPEPSVYHGAVLRKQFLELYDGEGSGQLADVHQSAWLVPGRGGTALLL